MQEKQTPSNKETSNDRNPHPWLDAVGEPERPREETFQKVDDDDELPFDLPRD